MSRFYSCARILICLLFFFCIAEKGLLAAPKLTPIERDIQAGLFPLGQYFSLKQILHIPTIYTDATLLRFVSNTVALNDRDYRPENLVPVANPFLDEAGRKSYICEDTYAPLEDLSRAFFVYFHEPLVVVSAFRSVEYQKRLWNLGRCNDGEYCAPPGHSEHQLGRALDFFDASSREDFQINPKYKAYVRWLAQNAHLYGFSQSYKQGPLIDGYEIEPWHWRYLGEPMATRLMLLDWTYTRYIRFLQSTSLY